MNQGRFMIGKTEILFPVSASPDAKVLVKIIQQVQKEVGSNHLIDRLQYHEVDGQRHWGVFLNGNGHAYDIVKEELK